jgi:hypothetical protein
MRQTVLRHRYVLLILKISLLQCSTCTARPPRKERGPLITLSLPKDLQAQTRTNLRIYLQSANVMPGTRRFELSACIPLYQANGGIGAVSHEHFALPNVRASDRLLNYCDQHILGLGISRPCNLPFARWSNNSGPRRRGR